MQHKVTVQRTVQLSRQGRIPNTVKHLRSSILQKDAQVYNNNFLRAPGGVFVELGHFDKRGPTGKHFGNFSPRCSWNYILNGKFNIPEYPYISLKLPEQIVLTIQESEDAWSSSIFNRLLKMPRVLNRPGFWIWHGCICKHSQYVWLWVCTLQ